MATLPDTAPGERDTDLIDLALLLARHWKLLLVGPLLAGVTALGLTYLFSPVYTARTTFLPPQQQQGMAASALSSLGALSGLAAGLGSMRTPADQYVALLKSVQVEDRLIDAFGLQASYDVKTRSEAREKLEQRMHVVAGKKDGLITVDIDDESPQRAAEMANRSIDELRRLTAQLALTEAQQRRVFFEGQLTATRDKLTAAQQALQSTGFNAATLRAEPRAAAENYARLRAEVTTNEVRLQAMRRSLTDEAPEVQTLQSALGTLRSQLGRLEATLETGGGPDYIAKYREFKYQEALFEMFARQFELARVDESKESGLIQVIDPASAPELKSRPKRGLIAAGVAVGSAVLLLLLIVVRNLWAQAAHAPGGAERARAVRHALRGQ
jgi:uncharacterized protein involved in exopolysaccharide biosynthesis